MKLEYSILEHLSSLDNGKFIDITFLEEDYSSLIQTVDELKGKNMILVDESGSRDFEAFGIGNDRKKLIKAKIKMNGRVKFHSMQNIKKAEASQEDRSKKNRWSMSYFFSF